MTYRKKLIEVSLPLEAINREAAREKSIRHGHPSTLHLWWARRPLAACRAVLFASLVDDPSEYMPDEESARIERERLFDIIEELVKWENSNNEEVLDKARLEIARSVARTLNVDPPIGKEAVREFLATKAPPVLDPFAGGGSIPLEAQRLGLRAYASDLNPVAVLINKALIEIPPKFANMPPVHPPEESPSPLGEGSGVRSKKKKTTQPELWQREWKGAQGLAEDVRYYGKWMRDEAFKRIGHLYPPVTITKEMLAEHPDLKKQGLKPGEQLTVLAWLWARTIKCPNPACRAQMPLARSFVLSTKKDKAAWFEPIFEKNRKSPQINFIVKSGRGDIPEGTVNRNGARCICCDTPVSLDYVRDQGKAGNMKQQMTAIIAEGPSGRVFINPLPEHISAAGNAKPNWRPDQELQGKTTVSVPLYGMNTFGDLFTDRQLVALNAFCEMISSMREIIVSHAKTAGVFNPVVYANSVITYLAFAIDYGANYWSTMATLGEGFIRGTFVRQAVAMVWDYAEANPFSTTSGNWSNGVDWIERALKELPKQAYEGTVKNSDAAKGMSGLENILISTDPPYYDNIEYADLSDYFYVWLRYSLNQIYPDLFSTLLTPKNAELVASPWRFNGNKDNAEEFFENGLRDVFKNIRSAADPDFPITIYYAFRQSESEQEDDRNNTPENIRASTGWETMLEGVIQSSLEIVGTWPMRTERQGRSVGLGANALASSIVLVCRPRLENARSCSRREFLSALKKELAPALRELQQGSIAPVDLAQAAIGPGMAVYSRYSAVLEADGKPMSVRTALALINQALDEYLAEQEGEYDADTRWALAWFEQFGHNEAPFGVAETLSKAKNTSVNGLVEAGFLEARGGKVRLLRRDELNPDWDPAQDKRPTAWEAVQHLIRALESQGEASAAELLTKLGAITDPARDLAYRLYTVCERKGWAQDALGYNMLVVAWSRLKELASRQKTEQGKLL
ncbi:MAG: hypothetical protein DPW18_01575 [Chloroflexi bacterium]|nr:hypothetical protein [Chloroflexota bacterium]MDL1943705.1 DUF1156 domain-containing protein [Chloroflexi bacterium CFX2]